MSHHFFFPTTAFKHMEFHHSWGPLLFSFFLFSALSLGPLNECRAIATYSGLIIGTSTQQVPLVLGQWLANNNCVNIVNKHYINCQLPISMAFFFFTSCDCIDIVSYVTIKDLCRIHNHLFFHLQTIFFFFFLKCYINRVEMSLNKEVILVDKHGE